MALPLTTSLSKRHSIGDCLCNVSGPGGGSGVTHVYTLSAAFRAERSRTRRHLAEFRMLEAELAPVTELCQLTGPLEQLTRHVTESFLASCGPELELMLPDTWREQTVSGAAGISCSLYTVQSTV